MKAKEKNLEFRSILEKRNVEIQIALIKRLHQLSSHINHQMFFLILFEVFHGSSVQHQCNEKGLCEKTYYNIKNRVLTSISKFTIIFLM